MGVGAVSADSFFMLRCPSLLVMK